MDIEKLTEDLENGNLTEHESALLRSFQFAQNEIKRHEAIIALHQTAQKGYRNELEELRNNDS